MEIDAELATYLQPGPFSVIVSNCDSELTPESVRGWGQTVSDDGKTIEVFASREASRKLLANLAYGDAIAIAIANVTTYQAVQIKGRCLGVGEPNDNDRQRIRDHGEYFVSGLATVGVREQAGRGALVSDVVRLRISPETLFDQTPGPQAGEQR